MKLQNAKLAVTFLTIAGLLVAAAVTIFLFAPSLKEDKKLSDEIRAAHDELGAQYANRRNLLSSLDQAAKAREAVHALSAQFVPAGRELDLITAVEALAAKDGVEEHMQLSANEGPKNADELRERFDLNVAGPYRKVMQMLVDLEKMPTLLVVQGLEVRPGAGATPQDQSFLSISMHGVFAIPPKGL